MSDCVTAQARNSNLAESSLTHDSLRSLRRVSIFHDSYARLPSRRYGVAREKACAKRRSKGSPFAEWVRAESTTHGGISPWRTEFFSARWRPHGKTRNEKAAKPLKTNNSAKSLIRRS